MENKTNKGVVVSMVMGGLVYLGVILVSILLTILFITGILPEDAIALRALMSVAVVMVGMNAIALPVALHYWCKEGWHRGMAIAFYSLDMLVLAVNIVVSFSTLSGGEVPLWVEQYTPYSVGMFIFALITWGVLAILDPAEQQKLQMENLQADFRNQTITLAKSYLNTVEGKAAIADAASKMLPSLLSNVDNNPKSWVGTPTITLPTPVPTKAAQMAQLNATVPTLPTLVPTDVGGDFLATSRL